MTAIARLRRASWLPLKFTRAIALALLIWIPAEAARGCDQFDFRFAATQLSQLNYDQATKILRNCEPQTEALYLLGMIPRFGTFDAEELKDLGTALQVAADRGSSSAKAIVGARLIDGERERPQGLALLESAAAAGDAWGLGLLHATRTIQGERLNDAEISRIAALEMQGFPMANGILVGQMLFRTSDHWTTMSPQEVAESLSKARDIAAKGVVQGDALSLEALVHVNQQFGISSQGLGALSQILHTPDSIDFSISKSQTLKDGYEAWRLVQVFAGLTNEFKRELEAATEVCRSEAFNQLQQICEIRSSFDHYVCLQPFSAVLDAGEWLRSPAYARCRSLRLHVRPGAPYY